MSLKNGDFILANYTLKIKETGETVATTLESVAKASKLYRGEERYEPYFIIVGEGWVPKGLDEALTGFEVGKATAVELPPEKGYGIRRTPRRSGWFRSVNLRLKVLPPFLVHK